MNVLEPPLHCSVSTKLKRALNALIIKAVLNPLAVEFINAATSQAPPPKRHRRRLQILILHDNYNISSCRGPRGRKNSVLFFFCASEGFEFLKDKGTQGLSEQTLRCRQRREHLLLSVLTLAQQLSDNLTYGAERAKRARTLKRRLKYAATHKYRFKGVFVKCVV